MDDPTRLAKKQLQVNGSHPPHPAAPHRGPCSPSPTSFHWEQYFFSQSPLAQGLYLTRSKSFPYYLLAIALSLFQTSSSGFVLLDQGARHSLSPLSSTCRCVLSISFGCHPNPIHCGALRYGTYIYIYILGSFISYFFILLF